MSAEHVHRLDISNTIGPFFEGIWTGLPTGLCRKTRTLRRVFLFVDLDAPETAPAFMVVTDPNEYRLNLAKAMGATLAITPK
jgi:hypothetical protein